MSPEGSHTPLIDQIAATEGDTPSTEPVRERPANQLEGDSFAILPNPIADIPQPDPARIDLAAKDGGAVGTALASIYQDESLAFRNLFELATRYVAARAHGHTSLELNAEREAYEEAGRAAFHAARPTPPPPVEAPPERAEPPLIKPEPDEPIPPSQQPVVGLIIPKGEPTK